MTSPRYALASSVAATAATLLSPIHVRYFFLVLAVASFIWLMVALTRGGVLGRKSVTIAGGVLMLIAVLAPPRFSRDVWVYADYGAMLAQHHANPLTHVPDDFPTERWYPLVNPRWRQTSSVYGPLFAGLSGAGLAATSSSPLATRLYFQLLAGLAVAGIAWIVARKTKGDRALAFVLLNPLVIVSVVNAGHNDPLVALGVLGAVVLARDRRVAWAAAALALAALVKVVAIVPAAAIGIWLLRRKDVKGALLFGSVFAVIALGGYAVAGGSAALKPLREASLLVAYPSFWNRALRWMSGGSVLHTDPRVIAAMMRLRKLTAPILAFVTGLAILFTSKHRDPALPVAAGLTAYLLASPYVLPWYAMWVVPLLALDLDHPLDRVSAAYAGALVLAYVPVTTEVASIVRPFRNATVQALQPLELVALAAVLVIAWKSRNALDPDATVAIESPGRV